MSTPQSSRADSRGCDDTYFHYLPGYVDGCLGRYDWNRGDYRRGLEFLKLAAGWGNKEAQYNLGLIYYNGRQVTADPALGIAWLELANERHDSPKLDVVIRSAIKYATPAQRERASHLFQGLRKRYGDNVAAARAWRQFEHWTEYVADERVGFPPAGCVMPPFSRLTEGVWRTLDPSKPPSVANPAIIYSGPCLTFVQVDEATRRVAAVYFHGWNPHVLVGPLHQVPASASPAR